MSGMSGSGGPGGSGGMSASRIIFVLTPARAANLLPPASPADLSALDGQCTSAAHGAGHLGNYGVLLADSAVGVSRFNFATTRLITLPDGTPVSFGLLFSGGVMHA